MMSCMFEASLSTPYHTWQLLAAQPAAVAAGLWSIWKAEGAHPEGKHVAVQNAGAAYPRRWAPGQPACGKSDALTLCKFP